MDARWPRLLLALSVAVSVSGCCRRTCPPVCGPGSVRGAALEGPRRDVAPPTSAEPSERISVRITVLDRDGAPVRGAEVFAYGKNPRSRSASMPAWAGHGGPRGRVTDAHGVALLPGLDPAATYRFAIDAPRDRPELREPPAIADWKPRDETVRLGRWYVVKGVVRDPAGRPVGRAHVSAKESPPDHPLRSYTAEDGTFSIESVPEGPLTLVVELSEGVLSGPSRPPPSRDPGTVVQAGDENVTLAVDVGAELLLSLDRAPDEPPDGVVHLWKEDHGRVLGSATSYVRDGVARFRGLRPDETYGLWVSPTKDGRLVYRTDVRPGDLRARRKPGKTITVRVRAPAHATHFGASVQGLFFTLGAEHTKAPDHEVVIGGLPRRDVAPLGLRARRGRRVARLGHGGRGLVRRHRGQAVPRGTEVAASRSGRSPIRPRQPA